MSNWVMAGVAVIGVIIAYYAWKQSGSKAASSDAVTGDSGTMPTETVPAQAGAAPGLSGSNSANSVWSGNDYLFTPTVDEIYAATHQGVLDVSELVAVHQGTYIGGSSVGVKKQRNPYQFARVNADTGTLRIKSVVATAPTVPEGTVILGGGGGGGRRYMM